MTTGINAYWLCNYVNNVDTNDWSSNLKSLWNCEWNVHLDSDLVGQIIDHRFDGIDLSHQSPETLLLIGISSLQAFVQDNFVGPPLSDDIEYQQLRLHQLSIPNETIASYLISDGVELNCNVRNAVLLALAKFIFAHLHGAEECGQNAIVYNCWYLRYCYIHQLVLDEHAETLYAATNTVSDELMTQLDTVELNVETKALVVLEMASVQLHYRRVWLAEQTLATARRHVNASLCVEGRLGVRTKFQQQALPQLLLRVQLAAGQHLDEAAATHPASDINQIPHLLQLDDDVRLEKIKFIDPADNVMVNVGSVLQALILATFKLTQISQPNDKLTDEELLPYLNTLLQQDHGPWPIRMAALELNVAFEASHKRTVERSLRQCEQLLKLLTSPDGTDKFNRLAYVYTSYPQPNWCIRATLGDLMVSLGLIKSALDQYLQIKKWDSVISCYTALDLKHKAADVIRGELEKQQTAELYCLLGDATDDMQWYEKAWEFSKQRSGRAQRHLGCYYFARKQYAEAIPYLERSLTINSLQVNVWARLGYAALALERWELAAHAYRQYTNIEPNGFECWNNLAKAYINLGDKKRAHRILNEALRCNFDNWKVWENFLIVSIDTGHFEDVLNAHQRLTELRGKYLDKQVIGMVVRAIRDDLPDSEGRPASRLRSKTQKVLAQLCVQYTNEGALFEYAAQLLTDDPLAKAQKLQKAYRAYTQPQANWSKHPDTIDKVLHLAQDLCEASLCAFNEQNPDTKSIVLSQLSSARLSAQGCLRAPKDDKWEDKESLATQIQTNLDQITGILTANM